VIVFLSVSCRQPARLSSEYIYTKQSSAARMADAGKSCRHWPDWTQTQRCCVSQASVGQYALATDERTNIRTLLSRKAPFTRGRHRESGQTQQCCRQRQPVMYRRLGQMHPGYRHWLGLRAIGCKGTQFLHLRLLRCSVPTPQIS